MIGFNIYSDIFSSISIQPAIDCIPKEAAPLFRCFMVTVNFKDFIKKQIFLKKYQEAVWIV